MRSAGEATREFDPFGAVPGAARLRALGSPLMLLSLPLLLGMLLAVAAAEGTMGEQLHVRPIADIRLAMGASESISPPEFPLARDFLTVWLIGAIAVTLAIMHRQWQLMSRCVTDLELSGVINARKQPLRSVWLALGDRCFPSGADEDRDALEKVMRHARTYVLTLRKHIGLLFAAAIVCTLGIVVIRQDVLFAEFVSPEITSDVGIREWLTEARSSWWAGFDHPVGAVAYLIVAALGIWVVLLQNAVGLICGYFVLTLPKVAHLGADWLNRDGLYGWRPIALIFATVYWSMILHGVSIGLIVLTLGPDHVLAILPLLVIWLTAIPLYIFTSIRTFRRVERIARDERLAKIEAEMQEKQISIHSPMPELAPYLNEIERVACAKIRPLSLGWLRESVVITAFALPIALTIFQLAAA